MRNQTGAEFDYYLAIYQDSGFSSRKVQGYIQMQAQRERRGSRDDIFIYDDHQRFLHLYIRQFF